MRRLVSIVAAPFVGAALLTAMVGPQLPIAHACECVGDSFWVVEDVTVTGAAADFPTEGHLYPDRLNLWAEGVRLDVGYGP